MPSRNIAPGRVRRTVNDLVMAEMFLVQATIESATVIGDGINQLSKHITQRDETDERSISALLQSIADDAVEPYSSRYEYFREMLNTDD
ncbi:Uncharacterised protein [Halioglobus japonicus]|nr:Uncharacterised protein [Halioglobus japonicus]